jgi:2-amino-4-hydroxy-6-hydroxymethyldihydropteridine diphosphokinase
MSRVYLLLGSNLNNRTKILQQARDLIAEHVGAVISTSSVYESEPWGFESDMSFLNQVLEVECELSPFQLLDEILGIEKMLGRTRPKHVRYQSREIDIDILFYDDMVLESENLQIPHPRLHQRLFALIPLSELNKDLSHPGLKRTISQLIQECTDESRVAKI